VVYSRFDSRFDSNKKKRFAGPYLRAVMQQIFRHLSETQLVYVDSYTLSSQTV